MAPKKKPVKAVKKKVTRPAPKKPAPKKLVKAPLKRKRPVPSKGIMMTIVAFGVFASFFVLFAMQKQIKETNLLGTYSYLSREADVSSPRNVTLINENGEKVFVVKGTESKMILGVIPVEIHKTIEVSADTGTITQETLPLVDRILNVISM